jgi:hypothetical protein
MPLRPGRTWRQTHGPCLACHQDDHCAKCHYKENEAPPASFDHRLTGQELDKDHEKLACVSCHAGLKTKTPPTCGDADCHKPDRPVAFPTDRPGALVAATQPAPGVAGDVNQQEIALSPATQPATRPIIIRIRR